MLWLLLPDLLLQTFSGFWGLSGHVYVAKTRSQMWHAVATVGYRGLPWATVGYRGLPWATVGYRGLPWATVATCVKKSLLEILSNVEDALPQAHAQAPHVP